MDGQTVKVSLLVPPPNNVVAMLEEDSLPGIVAQHPDRFALVLGGGSLNPMIQEAVKAGAVSADLQRRFEARAAQIVQSGAVGFGEMAALHFSFVLSQPYIEAPPDHPLFLRLADIAAQNNMPINLHIEAVARDMPLPVAGRRQLTSLNPPQLHENITAFERLLSHNPKARIIWEQTGWDNTGDKTAPLLRRLLEAHPNLYLGIKIRRDTELNTPVDRRNRAFPEWLDLIRAFPDRFVISTDTFFGSSNASVQFDAHRALLEQLPPDTARAVAVDNAVRLYRLKAPR